MVVRPSYLYDGNLIPQQTVFILRRGLDAVFLSLSGLPFCGVRVGLGAHGTHRPCPSRSALQPRQSGVPPSILLLPSRLPSLVIRRGITDVSGRGWFVPPPTTKTHCVPRRHTLGIPLQTQEKYERTQQDHGQPAAEQQWRADSILPTLLMESYSYSLENNT